jgi:hypothetical protein
MPALLVLGASAVAGAEPTHLRPLDVLADSTLVGKNVEVDVVEPLAGPTTAEQLARSEYGQLEVRIPEGGAGELALVPASWTPDDANRFRRKFDRLLIAPLRVRGTLLRDAPMSDASHHPYLVLRVASAEPLDLGPSEPFTDISRVAAEPARWDRRSIRYEGDLRSGFELSTLDGKIWLELAPGATVLHAPSATTGAHRVRASGVLFARPGARYGHLGSCAYLLLAHRLEYIPTR